MHCKGVAINPDLFSLKQIPLMNWKEHSASKYKSIIENGSMGMRSESKKHKTDLFLLSCESARTVIVRSTGKDKKMNKEWHQTLVYITSVCDVLKTKIWYFIKVAGDAVLLCDNMPSSALYKIVTFEGEVFVRKETPDFNQARGGS